MDSTKINIGLIGCGYWGSNFFRIILQTPNVVLKYVCDTDNERLLHFHSRYNSVKITTDYLDLVNDPDLQAVVVCTPVSTHFQISKDLLISGKHVLCEKPLSTTEELCIELNRLSQNYKRILLTGHVFEYHKVLKKMKEFVDREAIGKVKYLQFTRMGLGLLRKDVNVVFDLAAHDVGMALSILGRDPVAVTANGSGINKDGQEEVAFIQLEFPKKVFALINVSWIDPIKQRLVKVVGSKKMMVFDDISISEKLKIIDIGTSYQSSIGDYGSFQMAVKDGDIVIPNISLNEPLVEEFGHFIDCINEKVKPITDGNYARKVVKVLEAANQSIKENGKKVCLK